MATIKRSTELRHRADLGEDTQTVAFEAGDEVTILATWQDSYLIRNEAGLLFNVPHDLVET